MPMRMVDRQAVEALALVSGEAADPIAVAWAERVIRHEVARVQARELHLVTIDGWFSQRWLGFSHKELGTVRVASPRLRVPPFVPNRVLTRQSFVRESTGAYYLLPRAPSLHRRQTSTANRNRLIETLFPDAALFWWSGATRDSGRGALMAYLPGEGGHCAWYAEIARGATGTWRISRTVGVGANELTATGFTDAVGPAEPVN